jgi:hypothetical protein
MVVEKSIIDSTAMPSPEKTTAPKPEAAIEEV